jgi:hypothetical protein
VHAGLHAGQGSPSAHYQAEIHVQFGLHGSVDGCLVCILDEGVYRVWMMGCKAMQRELGWWGMHGGLHAGREVHLSTSRPGFMSGFGWHASLLAVACAVLDHGGWVCGWHVVDGE